MFTCRQHFLLTHAVCGVLLQALDAFHGVGLLHNDLHLENIMVDDVTDKVCYGIVTLGDCLKGIDMQGSQEKRKM